VGPAYGLGRVGQMRKTKKTCRDFFEKKRRHMSALGVFVPILHIVDKFLYHQNTTCKLLYENAHDEQVVVLLVQLPLYFIAQRVVNSEVVFLWNQFINMLHLNQTLHLTKDLFPVCKST
jgi:hypothetical protein